MNDDQRLQVWGVMEPPQLLAYGQTLAAIAQHYAKKHGVTEVLGQRQVDWADATDPRAQCHITDSLARWSIFWGKRGFGSEPFFLKQLW